jgi:hypothetical protein
MMSCVGRVVGVVMMAGVLGAAHVINTPLLLGSALIVEPPSLGRVAPVGFAWRSGQPPVADLVHAGTVLVRSGLLGFSFVFPLAHPLRRHRWRPMVMVPVHRRLRHHARLRRRKRRARLRTLVAMWVIWRWWWRLLLLLVGGLGRRHAVVMHTAAVVPRTTRPVMHRVWRWWAIRGRT